MSSYTANNKLIFSWNKGAKPLPPELLSSYAESLIFDGVKRTFWHKGHQYGNSYYGSLWGENFNDFLHNSAIGAYSHAEGSYSTVTNNGIAGHAEGIFGIVNGKAASVQGSYNYASGESSHAEGILTSSYGIAGHSEGIRTSSSGSYSHAEGEGSTSSGIGSHAEGRNNQATGDASHVEGNLSISEGQYSHAEGNATSSHGIGSHSEGYETISNGDGSHAEGIHTSSDGQYSHAEGDNTTSTGLASHAEGSYTHSKGQYSHTEGLQTLSNVMYSHAEGEKTTADGVASHAEGLQTYSYGRYSHAEGKETYAIGAYSHTEGIGTQAYNPGEVALGSYNISNEDTIVSVGDGISYDERHNVIEVTPSYTYIANKTYFGDYTFAPLTYSYVDYTGPEKPMNLIIKALMDEADYKKPVMYTKFFGMTEDIGYWDFTDYRPSYMYEGKGIMDVSYVTMEIGSYFHPGLNIYWPDVDQNLELATRMSALDQQPDYASLASYRTGYSYGTSGENPIDFYYNRCSSWIVDHTAASENATGSSINIDINTTHYTYITNELDFDVIDNVSVSYAKSSHMLYEQLKRVGLYQISYGYLNPYFDEGVCYIPQKLVVQVRYKWYSGFSNELPQSREDICSYSHDGFLTLSKQDGFTYCQHKADNRDNQCTYFWCACPEEYDLVKYDETHAINVCLSDSINFDLVTDVQPIRMYELDIPLAMDNSELHKTYKVYYVKFDLSPLGDGNENILKFVFESYSEIVDPDVMITEDFKKVIIEDESANLMYDEIYED